MTIAQTDRHTSNHKPQPSLNAEIQGNPMSLLILKKYILSSELKNTSYKCHFLNATSLPNSIWYTPIKSRKYKEKKMKPSLALFPNLFAVLALFACWQATAAPSFLVQPYLQNPTSDAMSVYLETTDQNVQLHYRLRGSSAAYTSVAMEKIASTSSIYKARATGLSSNTGYEYYVSTNGGNSAKWSFKTWPVANDNVNDFKMVAFSDSQGQHVSRLEDIIANGIISIDCNGSVAQCNDEIAAIIVPGDLVQSGGSVSQWRNDFFAAAADLLAHVAVIPAIGNHDYSLTHFTNYFELPDNGYQDYDEQWYVQDYLNLRLITLNSNGSVNSTLNNSQRQWLESLLADTALNNDIDYVMLQIHHPCKSEMWIPGESQLTCEYVEKFENLSAQTGKITGHIFGHTHAYSRGQSRDVSHLWLNAAVSSGDIDYWDEYPQFDYDEFQKSYPEYGYSTLVFGVNQTQMHVKRYSGGDGQSNYWGYQGEGIRDDFTVGGDNTAPQQPTAFSPNNSQIQGEFELIASDYSDADNDQHLEAHWQVSSDPQFATAELDFWGNKTRSENIWKYVNTQQGVALNNYQVSTQLPTGTYHWRVRYRDEHWAWSDWSNTATFSVEGLTYSDNLVLNGGAENGISNWTIETGVVEANASGDCSGVTAQSGDYYFAVGGICQHSDIGQAAQTVDLSEYSADIELGTAKLELMAQMRDWNGSDVPQAWVDIYDAEQNLIASSELISNASSSWTNLTTLLDLPNNAATATVRIKGTKNTGTDNDSYIDEISLRIAIPSLAVSMLTTNNLISNGEADQGLDNWQIETGVVEAVAAGECNGASAANSGNNYFALGGICSHSSVG